jgi:dipeptidyl aminopeptidase/acylaminoacyl peptidase
MNLKRLLILTMAGLLLSTAGCNQSSIAQEDQNTVSNPGTTAILSSTSEPSQPATTETLQATPLPTPSSTPHSSPQPTHTPFPFGKELAISYLQELEITGSDITIEQSLSPGSNHQRYLASYSSEGYTIYGLLTVPSSDPPPDGFKAIVFNHGYIPPDEYQTGERYKNYVNYLAQSGFVVFMIDFRGHGQSEGYPSGAYFSPGYTIDAISAVKSLQTLDYVDPDGIGMWGHSMGGHLVLRSMLVEPAVKAGVIWAGAVYSYEDLATYGIRDTSYRPPATPENSPATEFLSSSRIIFETYGWPDLDTPYWNAISLTENLANLNRPIQLHHAVNDPVVDINYAYGLVGKLQAENKPYGFYVYQEGGHNLNSPAFEQAMWRTVQFFQDNL